jgi:hypothetical protein
MTRLRTRDCAVYSTTQRMGAIPASTAAKDADYLAFDVGRERDHDQLERRSGHDAVASRLHAVPQGRPIRAELHRLAHNDGQSERAGRLPLGGNPELRHDRPDRHRHDGEHVHRRFGVHDGSVRRPVEAGRHGVHPAGRERDECREAPLLRSPTRSRSRRTSPGRRWLHAHPDRQRSRSPRASRASSRREGGDGLDHVLRVGSQRPVDLRAVTDAVTFAESLARIAAHPRTRPTASRSRSRSRGRSASRAGRQPTASRSQSRS